MSFLRHIWQYLKNWWYEKEARGDVSIDQNPQKKISIAIGGSTKLSAHVTTSSPIESFVKWHKLEDGNSINIQTDSIKYSGSSCLLPTPALVINDLTIMDSGVYQLSVTSFNGIVNGPNILLEVYDPDDSLTREESNFLRFQLLCQTIATESVRLYFTRKVPELTLASHLNSNKKDLQYKWKCTKDQFAVLFPAIPHNVKASQFDFTLLYTLIRNTITPILLPTRGWGREPLRTDITEEDDIERIRHYRNELAHRTELKLNDLNFNYMWNDLSKTIQRLSYRSLSKDVSNLLKCYLDHRQSRKCLQIDLAGMKHEMNILHQEMKDYKIAIVQNQESVKKMEDLHIPANVRQIQLSQLQTWKEEDEIYYHETKSYQATENMVKFCSVICLVGTKGCGKTATARHLALEYEKEEGWEIVPLCKIDDIVQYGNTKLKQIFVIDDILGVFSVDMSKYNNLNIHKECIMHVLGSKSKLVCTCRTSVYKEATTLQSFVLDNIVDLESTENILEEDDKERIFANHCKFRRVPENIYNNVSFTSSFIMFPLLCKIFSTHPEHHASVEKFFANPSSCLFHELDILKKVNPHQYAALVLCLLSNNALSMETIPVKQMKVDAYETCGLNKGTSYFLIEDSLSILEGTYLTKNVNDFTFIHDAIYEIIAFHYGKINPLMILKYMNSNFIATKVTVNRDQSTDFSSNSSIVIEEKHHEQLAKRIYTDLQSLKLFDVFMNKSLRYLPFLEVFINILRKQPYKELKALFCHELYYMSEMRHISSHNDRQNDEKVDRYIEKMRQRLLKNEYTHAKKQNNPRIISWIIYYGHTNLLTTVVNLVKENNDSTDVVFGADLTEQTRLLTLGCYSGVDGMVNLILKNVKIGCINVTSLDKTLNVFGVVNTNVFIHHNMYRTYTPLTSACFSGNLSIIRILLSHNANTDQYDDSDRFPLLCASEQGHFDVVEHLLQKSSNVNQCNKYKETSLHRASYNGHYTVVKYLEQKGADVNQCNDDNKSPLHKACKGGQTAIVEFLVYKGADVNQCSKANKSPLYNACKGGHTAIVEFLVDKGADVKQCSKANISPLYEACKGGHIDVVEILVDKGADVNQCSTYNISPLYEACIGGHTAVVEFLIEKEADINQSDTDNISPLYGACKGGHIAVVEFLVDKGADVNQCSKENISPLFNACLGGHTAIVKFLVDKGADVNQCGNDNNWNTSPLYNACKGGHTAIVEFLIDKGADVNRCTTYNWSPLHEACDGGHTAIVQFLIENGADVNPCVKSNWSPLYQACAGGHTAVVKYLVENRADVNHYYKDNNSPLYAATGSYKCPDDRRHDDMLDIVQYLIQKGADVNKCTKSNESLLFGASSRGHFEVVKLLVQKGNDVNQCNTNAESSLHKASDGGYFNVVEYLVQQGANVNQQNGDGETPFYKATTNGHLNVADYLVKNRADVNQCNKYNWSPLWIAVQTSQLKVVQYLVNKGANVNQGDNINMSALNYASFRGDIKVVELLLQNGAEVNKCSTRNDSPLHYASQNGYFNVVEFLVNNGANVNQCNIVNESPLLRASKQGHNAIVEFLVEKGADVNQCDKDNQSPLHKACGGGHKAVVEILVENRADVNHCNTDNQSPLHQACGGGHKAVVEFLVENGADINHCDNDNKSPLYEATQFYKCPDDRRHDDMLDIVQYLIQKGADVNKCTKSNESLLFSASGRGHFEVVKLLVQKGNDVDQCNTNAESSLHEASEGGYLNVVEYLVEQGARVNQQNTDEETPLFKASRNGHLNVVEYLVQNGADVNQCNKDKNTPLYNAVIISRFDMVKFLSENKADLTVRTQDGISPLQLLGWLNFFNIAEEFMKMENKSKPFLGNRHLFDILSDLRETVLCIDGVVHDVSVTDMNQSLSNVLSSAIIQELFQCLEYLLRLGLHVILCNNKKPSLLKVLIESPGVREKYRKVDLFLQNGADLMIRDDHSLSIIEKTKQFIIQISLIDDQKKAIESLKKHLRRNSL